MHTSCSGGGSNGSKSNPPPTINNLSGLAAEGNPLVNTLVEVRGANGQTTSTTTDAHGHFTANVSNLDYPMMVKSVGVNAYYSAIYSGQYLNVTPFTTLALASLLGTPPENIYSNFSAAVLKTPADLNLASQSVVQKFLALSALQNIDFFNDQFSAQGGDAYDDLLEALKDDLTANGKSLSQIANEIIVASNPSPNCPAGQHKDSSNVCTASIRSCIINNGVGEQVHTGNSWNACQVVSCSQNYVQSGSLCLPASRECLIYPANATSGTETWSGLTWGLCQIRDCSPNYILNTNSCIDSQIPISSNLSITSTNLTHAALNIILKEIGGKTLVMARSNDNAEHAGYIVDSSSNIKPFSHSNMIAGSQELQATTVVGTDLYYQVEDLIDANKLTLFKTSLINGGQAVKISLDSVTAGYFQGGAVELQSRGTNIYYKANKNGMGSVDMALYKYDTINQTVTKVLDSMTYLMHEDDKLSSGNLLMRTYGYSPSSYLIKALDANDQLIEIKTLLQSQYACGINNSTSPFYDCASVFLDGKIMIHLRDKTTNTYKMLVTDGTIVLII